MMSSWKLLLLNHFEQFVCLILLKYVIILSTEPVFVSRKGKELHCLPAHFRVDLTLNSLEGFLFVETANLL